IVGIGYGRPFPLFSPDEQSIVPRAWHMVHGGGLDPHWFDYPSLLLYLIAPFQSFEGSPSYVAGRLVVLVLALGAVAAAWWLGSRAYGGPAGAVAAALVAGQTTEVAYSRLAVPHVPLPLGVAVPIAFLARLWHGLGPALIVCMIGLVVALVQRRRADLILGSFVVVYFLDLCTLGAHFDRYVLPLLPALGALAGRMRGLAPVTLLLLVVPLTWSVRDARTLTKTDTRVVAHRWIESHLPHGARLATDSSLPPFAGFRVLKLQLPLPEEAHADPNRDIRRLHRQGVRYAVVTGAGAAVKAKPACPAAKGWQQLADRVRAPVYCPRWMPDPLNGVIKGQWNNIYSVSPDRSYLVGFIWFEHGSGELHVNLRGYPGRT